MSRVPTLGLFGITMRVVVSVTIIDRAEQRREVWENIGMRPRRDLYELRSHRTIGFRSGFGVQVHKR
jgi:hypothetical protein